MLTMLVRILASIQLIFIPFPSKKTYFFYVVATAISASLIMISHVAPEAARVLIFIGVLGAAPIGASCCLPYLLVYEYLTGPEFVTQAYIESEISGPFC